MLALALAELEARERGVGAASSGGSVNKVARPVQEVRGRARRDAEYGMGQNPRAVCGLVGE